MSGQTGPGALANIWFIAVNDVRFALSDRSVLLWLIIMPPIFFFFIGNATQAGFSSFSAPTQLVMTSPASTDFVATRFETLLEEAGFEILRPEDPDVTTNAGQILFAGDLSKELADGGRPKLEFLSSGGTTGLEKFKISAAVQRLSAELALANTPGSGSLADALKRFANADRPLSVEVRAGGRLARVATGIEQAVPGIMVMFTMLVLLTSGAVMLFLERQRGVLARLAAAPISRNQIVAGKWAGKMVLGLIQIGLAMIMGTLFFGMDWGPDLLAIGLVLAGWAAFCASSGVLLGSIGRSQSEVGGMGVLATMGLAALGGAWWPIEITPPWMQNIQKLVPSGWTMDALGRLINFGDGPASVILQVLGLAGAALLVGWLAARKFRFD